MDGREAAMDGSEVHGLLPGFLLLLIHECPGHGYGLIDRLPCLGITGVEPGHVYRVLRKLERDRLVFSVWVTSETGPARRRYELTAEGEAELRSWMARLSRISEVLSTCLARWEVSNGPDGLAALDGRPAPYAASSP